MHALEYFLCDVFTRQRLSGNQLAVFPDAGDLSDEQMQAIAREMNLSETAFVLRRNTLTEAARGYRVRIFTVKEELPFAGHPTLGTAAVIRRFISEDKRVGTVRLDENAGVVPVEFDDLQSSDEALHGEMTQPTAELGRFHAREVVAPALGLDAWDISPDLAPQTVSTGMRCCVVPLRSVDQLKYMRLNAAKEAEAPRPRRWLRRASPGAPRAALLAVTGNAEAIAARGRSGLVSGATGESATSPKPPVCST